MTTGGKVFVAVGVVGLGGLVYYLATRSTVTVTTPQTKQAGATVAGVDVNGAVKTVGAIAQLGSSFIANLNE